MATSYFLHKVKKLFSLICDWMHSDLKIENNANGFDPTSSGARRTDPKNPEFPTRRRRRWRPAIINDRSYRTPYRRNTREFTL